MLIFGCVLNAIALTMMTNLTLAMDYWSLAFPRFLQGFSMGFTFPPLQTLALATIRIERLGNATAAYNVVRNFGGSTGVALATTLLARRSQQHQSQLAGHLHAWSIDTTGRLQDWAEHFMSQGADSFTAARRATAMLYRSLVQQSQVLAYMDEFWLLSVLSLAILPLIPFMRRVRMEQNERARQPGPGGADGRRRGVSGASNRRPPPGWRAPMARGSSAAGGPLDGRRRFSLRCRAMTSPLETVEIETGPAPQAAVIWLHGLGADGHDFEPIVPELDLPAAPGVRFVFPHAPMRPVTINAGWVMRAWYDVREEAGVRQEDPPGVRASQRDIEALIARERARGRGRRSDRPRRLLAGRRHGPPHGTAPPRAAGRDHGAVVLPSPGRHRGRGGEPRQPRRPHLHGPRHPGPAHPAGARRPGPRPAAPARLPRGLARISHAPRGVPRGDSRHQRVAPNGAGLREMEGA